MAAVRNRANGNGTAVRPTSPAKAANDQPRENIFLFIPNLIGSCLPCALP
jgi:hypothetical protein